MTVKQKNILNSAQKETVSIRKQSPELKACQTIFSSTQRKGPETHQASGFPQTTLMTSP
jgi:hypothetical protein